VHLTLDGVNGNWRWRRNLCQIDGENSKLRRQSSEFSAGNAVIYDRYLRCHFWMTPYVHNTECMILVNPSSKQHFGSSPNGTKLRPRSWVVAQRNHPHFSHLYFGHVFVHPFFPFHLKWWKALAKKSQLGHLDQGKHCKVNTLNSFPLGKRIKYGHHHSYMLTSITTRT